MGTSSLERIHPAKASDNAALPHSDCGDQQKSNLAQATACASVKEDNQSSDAYKPEYAHMAKAMCAIGANDAALAIAFQVSLSAISLWREDHEEFSEAYRVGQQLADEQVQRSLHQRACGYEYDAEEVSIHNGRRTVTVRRKHVPADVGAAIFWLVNRDPKQWAKSPLPVDDKEDEYDAFSEYLKSINGSTLRPVERPKKSEFSES